jgi:GTP-binding protein
MMTVAAYPSFLTSAQRSTQFPADNGREVAFAGRSNAGKSSALNALLGRRKLARTSKVPGRTQLINFFLVAEHRRVVDLPGYGYARVPAAVRRRWDQLLEAYFSERRSLAGLIMVIDIRRGPNDLDRVLIDWARRAGVPATILLSKADKLSRGAARQRRLEIAREVEEGTGLIVFSSLSHVGLAEARERLWSWLGLAAGQRPA